VYFARAIDGEDTRGARELADHVRAEILLSGMRMVDPIDHELRIVKSYGNDSDYTEHLVRLDLMLLRKCDGLLIDMTIPHHSYVGCVCELTYAYLWNIPTAVYVGDSGNEHHHWLRFHARVVCHERTDAINTLSRIISE
jgi:nucleoside 2-deoxyribosyltransferase